MVTASNQYPAPTPGSGVRYLTYGFTHEAGFIDGNNLGQPHPFQVSAAPGGPYLFFFMSGPASGGQQLVEIEFPQATDFRLTRFGLFLPTNKRLTFNIQLDYYTPGACKVRPYIWDADTGVLLYGPANWTDRNRDPAHTLATDNPDLVVPGSNVAYFRTFELGQNGPFPSSTGLEYWENVWTYLSADPADLPGVKTGT
jgi:hypothetical protein